MSAKTKILALTVLLIAVGVGVYIYISNLKVEEGSMYGRILTVEQDSSAEDRWKLVLFVNSKNVEFSIESELIKSELENYNEKYIIIFYDKYFFTGINSPNLRVKSWKRVTKESGHQGSIEKVYLEYNALFCAFLGEIYQDKSLYKKVMEYIKKSERFLLEAHKCNIEDVN